MKLLSFECSAKAASCCISEDGNILGSVFSNVPLTHSQTLMPMMENLLSATLIKLDDIDCFAIAAGPGSFTGVRIGISAVKGLSIAKRKPCIPVSTLEAMAYMHIDKNAVICPVMDARCSQVYNALFKCENGKITRLCEDRALLVSELLEELKNISDTVIITGDGTDMFMGLCPPANVVSAPAHLKTQSAVGVALAAKNENAVDGAALMPFYLRLPQAERELKARNNK